MSARLTAIVLGVLLFYGAPGVAAAEGDRNSCGCYSDGAGNCYCDKTAKCGCAGQCEPRGCAEQRQRQLEKEIEAETRRAQQLERASEDRTKEDEAASALPPAPKTPPPPPASHAPKLTQRQRRDLARLLELYVAKDPERRAMSTDEILRNLGQAPEGGGQHH